MCPGNYFLCVSGQDEFHLCVLFCLFFQEGKRQLCIFMPEESDNQIINGFDGAILQPGEGEIVRPVYTKPLQEFRFRDFCRENGIASYLPLRKIWRVLRRSYKDRFYEYPRIVYRPMFPSYVFVRLDEAQRAKLFHSDFILRIIRPDNPDESVLLHEIETIRQIEKLEFNADIKEGERFLIESGPWRGVYGWLVKKDKRFLWVVEIECVQGTVSATINPTKYKMTRVED